MMILVEHAILWLPTVVALTGFAMCITKKPVAPEQRMSWWFMWGTLVFGAIMQWLILHLYNGGK